MPVIREYFVEPNNQHPSYPDTVTAEDFRRFMDGKLTWADVGPMQYSNARGFWHDAQEVYQWNPPVAAEYADYVGTLSDEALYRSNWRMIIQVFEDRGIDVSSSTGNIIDLPADNTFAIATACEIERDMSDYPVMDEEDYSNLEVELIEEGVTSYFMRDVLEILDAHDEFNFLWIEEDGFSGSFSSDTDELLSEIREEYRDIVDTEISGIGYDAVSYSGELYVGDMADILRCDQRHYPSPDTIEDYAQFLRDEAAKIAREQLERVQPPLSEDE